MCVLQSFISSKEELKCYIVATSVFLFATTTARTSNALLGWNCGYSFCSNASIHTVLNWFKYCDVHTFSQIMYGVLYAISPEIFPAKDRGTGNGLTATATRVFGVLVSLLPNRSI